jgi:hypothetical protein
MILIVTNKEDTHPTPVIEHLTKSGVPFFRFNTECLLTDYAIEWFCINNVIDFSITNTITITTILGSQIKSIWERRPEKPNKSNATDPTANKICLEEANAFLVDLQYSIKNVFSIGSAVYDSVAASKLLQFTIAKELGIKLPNTFYGNSKTENLKQVFAQKESVAIKSISAQGIDIDEQNHSVFWTKKVASKQILEMESSTFGLTTNFLQEYIEKQFEVRVTVVKDDVFAAKIESQHLDDNSGKVDFRQGYEGLKYSAIELPKQVHDFCIAFLQKINLNFGCFDFVIDSNNNYIFLECNPNGQWLWLELETGLQISKSIAKHLTEAK